LSRNPRLRHESPLVAGVDPGGGYTFSGRLSGAICEVVEALPLSVDGLDLGPALQRSLYIDLINRPELYAAFLAGGRVAVANDLEVEVVSELCPDARIDLIERPNWLERIATTRRQLRRPKAGPLPAQPEILAVAAHPKFARFLRPVLDGLDAVVLDCFTGPPLRTRSKYLRAYPEVLAAASALAQQVDQASPKVVVAAEGNAPVDAVLGAVAGRAGVPSVVVQQGWAAQVHAGFRKLPFDRMLVWGPGFARLLEGHNPELEFVVTGNYAIDPPRDGEKRDAVSVFMQSTSDLISAEHIEQLVQLTVELADEVPRVLVREHPSHGLAEPSREQLETQSNIAFANDVELRSVLATSVVALSMYSTTLFEAVPSGAIPVSFNPTSLPRLEPSIAALWVGFETRDRPSARTAISEALAHPSFGVNSRGAFIEEYFPVVGAEAVERAVGAIAEVGREGASA
jgi:hypothetical protein